MSTPYWIGVTFRARGVLLPCLGTVLTRPYQGRHDGDKVRLGRDSTHTYLYIHQRHDHRYMCKICFSIWKCRILLNQEQGDDDHAICLLYLLFQQLTEIYFEYLQLASTMDDAAGLAIAFKEANRSYEEGISCSYWRWEVRELDLMERFVREKPDVCLGEYWGDARGCWIGEGDVDQGEG